MSAKWLRLESDIVDHPKTGRLEAVLNEPLAGWYVIRALSWMSRFCPTGHVRDNDGTSLESSAKWRGTSGELLAALVSCGWLDVVPGGWEWHDWAEHQGKVAHKAAKERERKAAYRARASQNVPRDNDGTSAGRPAQRDVTGRDVTGREKEGSNASASTPPLQLEALPVKAVKARKPPDPAAEFARFKAACTDDELRVFDAYCTTFAVDMAPDWGLQKLVRQKLKAHTVDELCAAVRGAGRDPWHREKGSSLRALFSDASKVAQLAKRGAA